MGEPVTVVESTSNREGFARFETNRSLTGMGHEQYHSSADVTGNRAPDNVARQLFDTNQVDEVHIYGQAITVKLSKGSTSDGLLDVIKDLYTYYRPGVEVPTAESFAAG